MSVKLTVEFNTLEAAQIFLDNYIGNNVNTRPQDPTTPAPPAKPAKAVKADKVAAPKVAAPAAAPTTDPTEAYKPIKAAALKLANLKGREALVAVLDGRQLKTAQDAKPEEYPALLAALVAALL